jgi:hypothetical protein
VLLDRTDTVPEPPGIEKVGSLSDVASLLVLPSG